MAMRIIYCVECDYEYAGDHSCLEPFMVQDVYDKFQAQVQEQLRELRTVSLKPYFNGFSIESVLEKESYEQLELYAQQETTLPREDQKDMKFVSRLTFGPVISSFKKNIPSCSFPIIEASEYV